MPPPPAPGGAATLTLWREAHRLRLAGAALYGGAAFCIALGAAAAASPASLLPRAWAAGLATALHPGTWALGLVLVGVVVGLPVVAHAAALGPAAAAARRRVGGARPPPPAIARLPAVARPAAAAAWGVAARAASPATAQASALFGCACFFAGWAGVPLYVRLRGRGPAPAWAPGAGAAVGAAYAAAALARGADALCWPVLQRRRAFRVKRAALDAALPAAGVAVAGLVVAAVAGVFSGGAGDEEGAPPPPPPPPGATPAALLGCLLIAYGLELGGRVVEVVWTERLAFDGHLRVGGGGGGHPPPPLITSAGASNGAPPPALPPAARAANAALLDALAAADRDALLADAVAADLCGVAEGAGADGGARRRALFADPTGGAWTAPVRAALAEVGRLLADIAPALPGGGGGPPKRAAGAPAGQPAVRWNTRPGPGALLAAPLPPPSSRSAGGGPQPALPAARAAAVAAAAVRARWQASAWALRTLGALTAASPAEDAFGSAQLATDAGADLGSVLAALVAAARGLSLLAASHPAAFGPGGAAATLTSPPWLTGAFGARWWARALGRRRGGGPAAPPGTGAPPPPLLPGARGGVDAGVASLADVAATSAARALAAFSPSDASRALAGAAVWPVAGGTRAEVGAWVEAAAAEGGRA